MCRVKAWGLTPEDESTPNFDALELATGELMSNAAKVCTRDIRLRLTAHHDWVEVAVTDDSDALATVTAPDAMATGGRGLRLVEALTDDWGQYRHDGEKTVWARVAIRPGGAQI